MAMIAKSEPFSSIILISETIKNTRFSFGVPPVRPGPLQPNPIIVCYFLSTVNTGIHLRKLEKRWKYGIWYGQTVFWTI